MRSTLSHKTALSAAFGLLALIYAGQAETLTVEVGRFLTTVRAA